MAVYECYSCGEVFDDLDLEEFAENGEAFWFKDGDLLCPDCLYESRGANFKKRHKGRQGEGGKNHGKV